MTDAYSTLETIPNRGLTSPAMGAEPITISGVAGPVVLGKTSRAIWVGGAGNLGGTMLDGTTAIFVGILAGTLLPVRMTQVSTTSTATSMVSVY